jgi:hypothetical protein
MFSSCRVNFDATGNPNAKALPRWFSVAEKLWMTMEVGDNFHPIFVTGGKAKLGFFQKFFVPLQQDRVISFLSTPQEIQIWHKLVKF